MPQLIEPWPKVLPEAPPAGGLWTYRQAAGYAAVIAVGLVVSALVPVEWYWRVGVYLLAVNVIGGIILVVTSDRDQPEAPPVDDGATRDEAAFAAGYGISRRAPTPQTAWNRRGDRRP